MARELTMPLEYVVFKLRVILIIEQNSDVQWSLSKFFLVLIPDPSIGTPLGWIDML